MKKTNRKQSNAVEYYFQTVIKKSWTWAKLTDTERQRFIDRNDFDVICGNDKQRVEWLNSMYHAFLVGCGYDSPNWRENEPEANENENSNGKIVRVDIKNNYDSYLFDTFYLDAPDEQDLSELQYKIDTADAENPFDYADIFDYIAKHFKLIAVKTVTIRR